MRVSSAGRGADLCTRAGDAYLTPRTARSYLHAEFDVKRKVCVRASHALCFLSRADGNRARASRQSFLYITCPEPRCNRVLTQCVESRRVPREAPHARASQR